LLWLKKAPTKPELFGALEGSSEVINLAKIGGWSPLKVFGALEEIY